MQVGNYWVAISAAGYILLEGPLPPSRRPVVGNGQMCWHVKTQTLVGYSWGELFQLGAVPQEKHEEALSVVTPLISKLETLEEARAIAGIRFSSEEGDTAENLHRQIESLRHLVGRHEQVRAEHSIDLQREFVRSIADTLKSLRSGHTKFPLPPEAIDEVNRLEEAARLQPSLEEIHRHRFSSTGRPYPGIRKRTQRKSRRVTHCWSCKASLDSITDVECAQCSWILCWCGACGCGFR